jgi:LPS export ABC transporter protein LptC/lipopolysaccharide transport protein LptA
MALQRIVTYRLLGALRLVIPLVVLVLVAIPSWNYLSRRVRVELPKVWRDLPKNLDVRTEGFTHSVTEGGKTLFTIRANTTLGYRDNRYQLEDVDVTVNGETVSETPKRIRSKYCSYDQQTNDFKFQGNVEVVLDEKTYVRTDELTYNQGSRTVVSSTRATIDQPGSMTGQADTFEYGLDSGILKLNGKVYLSTPAHTSLEADSAVFQQKENWATMAGNVVIKSTSGWVRGQAGRADLQPGTYKPTRIAIETDVTAESRRAGFLWKLRAAQLEADISPQGHAERVRTRGGVELERTGGDERQVMTAVEVDAALDAFGKLEGVEARRNARMLFGADRTLQSDLIWLNATGGIATRDESVLRVGDSTIEGREFTIQQGDIVHFTTKARANLQSGQRKTSADRTEGRFDSKTNNLLELVQSGNFRFTEGVRQGTAQNARFENGGTVVKLEGSPILTDAQIRLEAGQIRLDQKENSFVATRNVKTLTRNTPEPVLVTAGTAEGGADNINYAQNVQLWRGTAYIQAEHLLVSSRNNSLHAEGRVRSSIEGVRATSDKLEYDDASRIAHYEGAVRAEKQGMILQTRDMTARLRDKDVEQIVATGDVVVTQGDRRGKGEKAVYEVKTESITLTGPNAEVYDKEQGTVRGTQLVMNTKGDSLAAEGQTGGRVVTRHTVR